VPLSIPVTIKAGLLGGNANLPIPSTKQPFQIIEVLTVGFLEPDKKPTDDILTTQVSGANSNSVLITKTVNNGAIEVWSTGPLAVSCFRSNKVGVDTLVVVVVKIRTAD
jgi:hypothetical protein